MTVVLPAGLEVRIVVGGCGPRKKGDKKGKPVELDDPTSPSPPGDTEQGCERPVCEPESKEVITITLPAGLEVRLSVGGCVAVKHPKNGDVVTAFDDPTSPSPPRDGIRASSRIERPSRPPVRKPSPRA